MHSHQMRCIAVSSSNKRWEFPNMLKFNSSEVHLLTATVSHNNFHESELKAEFWHRFFLYGEWLHKYITKLRPALQTLMKSYWNQNMCGSRQLATRPIQHTWRPCISRKTPPLRVGRLQCQQRSVSLAISVHLQDAVDVHTVLFFKSQDPTPSYLKKCPVDNNSESPLRRLHSCLTAVCCWYAMCFFTSYRSKTFCSQ